MSTFRLALTTAGFLSLVTPAAAQPTRVNADRLPINIQRIQRQLQTSTIREEREGLNLRYFLNVYGEAPALRLFTKDDNLATGPVPYGAPTHQEFINLWTPQEFRAPVMDFNALMRWLSGEASKKRQNYSR